MLPQSMDGWLKEPLQYNIEDVQPELCNLFSFVKSLDV